MKSKLIYCDAPYFDSTGYKNASKKTDFDHEEYYEWLRLKVKEGHIVLCSEYVMPDDFVCIFEKGIQNGMTKANDIKTEKLFIHKTQLDIYKKSFPDEV